MATDPYLVSMDGVSTDTNGTAVKTDSAEYMLLIDISGTATVKLEHRKAAGTWIALKDESETDYSFTASTWKKIELAKGEFRAVTSGTSGATVDVELCQVFNQHAKRES